MLLSHVSKHPVGCVIKITDDFLNLEKGTIYMGSNRHIQGSHAMVIVGYGEDNGINYWIVMNSWGEEWGDEGYCRICRDSSLPPGEKSILTRFSYPVLDD
ncbi:zingipain-2-like [Asparagus officinalis]|uniref:zingipain-2-like n=1 Tax=Asparagus officinalis TaxID=4686 RepID=UPI00098E1ECB|nr:zingipain-2-like [Asparagus officinalis]